MINNCVPSKKHYRCGKCSKQFSKITGDCISISDVHPKCPHCNSEEIIFTEEDGEQQICDYLDYLHNDTGYMLTFNFNKSKEMKIEKKLIRGKTIFEAFV